MDQGTRLSTGPQTQPGIPSIPRTSTPITTSVEPVKVIANILQSEMNLGPNQIVLDYEEFSIPTNGPLVVLGYLGPSEQIASQTYFDSFNDNEVQETVVAHHIQIDIMSIIPDNSARLRKEEILLALRSFYSQQQMDANLMGLSWLQSDIIDTTSAEPAAMNNRYTTTCCVYALHQKIKPAGYFNVFPIQLNVTSPAYQAEIDPTKLPT